MIFAQPYSAKKMLAFPVAMLMSCAALQVQGAELDQVTFPVANWNANLLKVIEAGPAYLPRDFDTGVKAFPANSSAQTRDELDQLLELQEGERYPTRKAVILRENQMGKNEAFQLFEYHHLFVAHTYPKTLKLLRAIGHDVDFFILREKQRFNRARPNQLDARISPMFPVPPHPAYPSGHAGQNYAAALILGRLDPAHRDIYETLALKIAQRREIAGVHYPSDSEAGRLLATNVVNALWQVPVIDAMYKDAAIEIKQNPPKIATQ